MEENLYTQTIQNMQFCSFILVSITYSKSFKLISPNLNIFSLDLQCFALKLYSFGSVLVPPHRCNKDLDRLPQARMI